MIHPHDIFGHRADRSQMGPLPPSILFVSHDASRTGAPIALLTFLRWLRANSDYRFEVLLGSGGALEPAFEAVAPTTNADVAAGRFLGHLSASVPPGPAERLAREATPIARAAPVHGRSCVLQHAPERRTPAQAVAPWAKRALSRARVGVVAEVSHLSRVTSEFTKDVTDHYVACSRVTLENLVSAQGVPAERITLCHAFIAVDEVQLARARADRHVTRRRLGISPDALVVGGVGTMDWRKGPDLFVQLAAMVMRRLPDTDVHFVWAGGDAAGPTRGGLLMDARRLGLGDRINSSDPWSTRRSCSRPWTCSP